MRVLFFTHMPFSTEPFAERIEKPWGFEVLYTPKDLPRTGKILAIKAGRRLSFQYHDAKEETMSLVSGRATIWLEDALGEIKKIPMELMKGYTVRVGQKHRLEAVEDSVVIEVSEPEKGNTYRISDDYERKTETEEMRTQENRGWQAPA